MTTTVPKRGEVWLVDLGIAAKVRPCLIVSIPADNENDRVLTSIIPHTTSTRGSRFEIMIESRFLKAGAFDIQNVITIPAVKLIRTLGKLTPEDMLKIEAGLKMWLGLTGQEGSPAEHLNGLLSQVVLRGSAVKSFRFCVSILTN